MLHAVIFVALHMFVEMKALQGNVVFVYNIRQKIKFLCLSQYSKLPQSWNSSLRCQNKRTLMA